LLKATGRENAPLEPMPWDDAYRSQDKTLTTAYTQNYTYDKMGNILKLQHLGNSNFTRNFSYNANSNKLDELQFGSTTLNYNYDPCGNLLNEDASRHNEWDYADRMRCFRIQTPNNEPSKYAQYLYDAEGNRVMKLVRNQGGTWSSIIYIDGIFEFLQNSDDEEQSNAFIMDDRSRIAIIRTGDVMGDGSPAVKYNLEDSLGSSMTLLSTDGSWISWEEYYPFGETSLGSYEKKRYRYVGKERDEESGLYYYGARYYAAWTCRFISVDPKALESLSWSPYNYTINNPLRYTDPDGRMAEESESNNITNQNDNVQEQIENDADLSNENRKTNKFKPHNIKESKFDRKYKKWQKKNADNNKGLDEHEKMDSFANEQNIFGKPNKEKRWFKKYLENKGISNITGFYRQTESIEGEKLKPNESGSNYYEETIDLGESKGKIQVNYNMYGVEDRLQVINPKNGKVIFDTANLPESNKKGRVRYRKGSGSVVDYDLGKGNTKVMVVVKP
jgi:RHS repeat-associated protein